jgi:outer membrane immunogenic protein
LIVARFAAGAIAASTLAGSALAAELAPPPPPVFSWTGFYVGVDGGFGGGFIDTDTILFQQPLTIGVVTIPGISSTLHTSNRTGGAVVGGQVGYNYQLPNNIVVGIESDAQWTNVAESEHEIATSTTPTLRFTDLRAGLDWFGTTRLRLGYAFGRFLPYITGGVSYGEVVASASQVVIGTAGTIFGSASATHAGWTAGAGAEYAVTDNISFKAEYLFVQLGGVSGSEIGFAPPVLGSSKTGSFGTNVVRAGLNWRFGGFGAVPGIASY